MSGYRVEIATAATDVTARGWPQESTPTSLYLSAPWALAQGDDAPSLRYVIATSEDDGKVAAVMPCRLLEEPPAAWRFDDVPGFLADVHTPRDLATATAPGEDLSRERDAFVRSSAVRYPALIATAPNGAIFGHAGRPAPGLQEALVDGLESLAQEVSAAMRGLWYARYEDFPQIRGMMAARGYEEVLVNADCVLEIRWGTMAEYLASLSPKARRNARREMKLFGEQGYRTEWLGADEVTPAMAELHLDLQRRHKRPASAGGLMAALRRLDQQFGDSARVIAVFDGVQPVGFMAVVTHAGHLHCRQAGFRDAHAGDKGFVYFNTVFYAAIDYAISQGLAAIEYGTEAYRGKHARGCRARPLFGYLAVEPRDRPTLSAYLSSYSRAVASYLISEGIDSSTSPLLSAAKAGMP